MRTTSLEQAGVLCNTPEESLKSHHGRIMGEEPLYTMKQISAPMMPWPDSNDYERPLAGIRVIDFSRVIAAPAVSKLLAALGADVLKVSHAENPEIDILMVDMSTGKRDAFIDLKTSKGKKDFERLIIDADILIDGFRPGVLERLGYDSSSLRTLCPTTQY
ncbi:hypothetical protein AAFC00_006097 [Neodothiora populina]|uniref:Uncharacterized protein n=1 Tax=Neodothiora populina TaxID=2781224 RepID=A0ABR3P405_9PEZI